MNKHLVITVAVALLSASPALAACPAPVAGNTAESIKANELRLRCLQEEITSNATRQQQQLEFNTLDQTMRMMELQRRFDALPRADSIVMPVVP